MPLNTLQQEDALILQLFQQLYRLDANLTEQLGLSQKLDAPSLKRFSVGEILPVQNFSPQQKILLLYGKIRVLGRSATGGKSATVMTFQPGTIWDGSFLETENLELRVSSEEALIYPLSEDVAASIPAIIQQWRNLQEQYRIAKGQQLSVVETSQPPLQPSSQPSPPPVQQSYIREPETTSRPSSYETSEESFSETFSQQAWRCLDAISEHYWRKPVALQRQIHQLSDLIKQLDSMQLVVKTSHLNWSQLLNAPYPVLVHDGKHNLHWIIGRQGNTLTEIKDGQECRYYGQRTKGSDIDQPLQTTYETLLLRPFYKRPSQLSFKSAFSAAWYLKLCCENWLVTGQMALISILSQIFSLAMPLFYLVIFDRVFGHQNLSTLNVMGIGILGLLTFDLLIKQIRSHILTHFLVHLDRVGFEILSRAFFRLSPQQSATVLNIGLGDRLMELTGLNQTLISTFLMTSMDVLFSVIVLVFLLSLNVEMALISIAALLPMAVLSLWKAPQDRLKSIENSKNQRRCQTRIREVLEYNEAVQSMNVGDVLQEKLFDDIDFALEKGTGIRFTNLHESALQGFIMTLGSMAMLYYGALMVIKGDISYGGYMAINMLSRNVFSGFQRLLSSYLQIQQGINLGEQFRDLVSEEVNSEVSGEGSRREQVVLNSVSGRIQLRDLSFRYHADLPWVLKDLNLTIEPGEKIILTGASGAGKTTLLRLLQRLYTPSSGGIYLDGVNLTDINVDSLRRHVGIAPQKPALFSCSIRENISLGNVSASQKELWEAVSLVQLDGDLLKKPAGLDTMVAPMGLNLSGGEIARISLARLFLLNPGLLLLDEALSACEPVLRVAIYNYIFNHYRNATCIFVNDDSQIHQTASRIVVLHNGKIVEQGHYQQLMQLQGYYFHLHAKL